MRRGGGRQLSWLPVVALAMLSLRTTWEYILAAAMTTRNNNNNNKSENKSSDGDNDNDNSNINNSSAGDNNNTLAFVGLETRAVLCPRLASLPLDQLESEGWHLFAPPRKASLVLLRERDRFTEVIAYCTLQGAFWLELWTFNGLSYYITMFFKLACCCWNFMIVSCFNMFSALLMLTYFLSCQRVYRDITWSDLEKDSPVASPQRRAAASFSFSEKHLVGWAGNYTTRPPFLDLYSMGPIVAPHFGIPVNQPVYWVFFCSSCLHLIARFPTNTTSIFSSPLLLMVFVRIWCAMCEKTSIWRYSYSSMAIIVIRWDMNHGPWPNSQKTWSMPCEWPR